MSVNKRNPCVDAIIAELSILRIPYTIEVTGGGHVRVKWQANPQARKRMYFTGLSPSDWRAPRKARADVRKMLRADGVLADNRTTPA